MKPNRLQMAALIALIASIVLMTLGSLAMQSDYGLFLIRFNMVFQTLFWPLLAAQAAFQRIGTRLATIMAAMATLGVSGLGLLLIFGTTGPGVIDHDWLLALRELGPAETVRNVLPLVAAKVSLTALIPFGLATLPDAKADDPPQALPVP